VKHRLWIIGGVVLAALALAIVAPRLVTGASLAKARDYDLIGMLREMYRTNTATQAVNDRILDSLKDVEQQASRVKVIDGKLTGLEAGVIAEQQAMERLKAVTAEHARLSRALQDLTATAADATAGIAETARAEARDLAAMKQVTATMASRMNDIGNVNGDIAGKLDSANTLSATILNDMP
jgi:hypothetical protein